MMEDLGVIRMNIARYQAMLWLDMDDEKCRTIEHLLAKARRDLALASKSLRQHSARE